MDTTTALRRRRLLAVLSAALVGGCGAGAIGQSTMVRGEGQHAERVDAPLAVGASIEPDVRAELRGSTAPTLVLTSSRPEVLTAEDGRITGRAPGVAAVLVTTKAGAVIDFYHLWVEQAERVAVQRLDARGRSMGRVRDGIDMLVGESVHLAPRLYTGAQQLEGTVDAQWEVDSPAAQVLRQGDPAIRRIVARHTGEATLTIRAAERQTTLSIRVFERGSEASRPGPGGASEALPEPAPEQAPASDGGPS